MLLLLKTLEKIVGHLPLKEKRNFAKTIFYFLRADLCGKWNITVTSEAVNVGDGDRIQLPYIVPFCT